MWLKIDEQLYTIGEQLVYEKMHVMVYNFIVLMIFKFLLFYKLLLRRRPSYRKKNSQVNAKDLW